MRLKGDRNGHGAAPGAEAFAPHLAGTPNLSGRMDEMRAAILTPQLATLPDRVARWTERYRAVEAELSGVPGLTLIERPAAEAFVGSSFQALLLDWPADAVGAVVAGLIDMRLPLTFTVDDCRLIARIIADEVTRGRPAALAAE